MSITHPHIFQIPWQSLGSGRPIIPYARVYIEAILALKGKENHSDDTNAIAPIHILEIGTFDGCSARIMYETLDRHFSFFKLTLIEPEIREAALELTDMKPSIQFIQAYAENVAHLFPDNHFDLMHIDMSPHSFEQHVTVHDLYWQKLKPRHSMIIHDYDATYGTYRFVNEVLGKSSQWHIMHIEARPESPTTRPVVVRRMY